MADLRISQLNALAGADLASEDLLVAVDDSASETKKLTVGDLIANGVTLIADDTIPGAKILFAAGDIATADLADGAVTTAKLADDGVTAAKLADESTIDLVTTLPASGAFTGQLALDTDDNFLYVWDGSAWVSLKAAGSINTVSGDTSGTINITATTSGSTVTVAATIDDTTVANQFLAGPTGAGGTVAYRVIDSTDLPTASTTAKGAVLVNGEGLRMDGDTIEVDNDVTDTTTHHVVTYSAKGLITGGRVLTSADLPLATSTDAGAVIPGDGLAVDVNGNLSIDNTVAAGTYTKVTVTAEGVVSTGDTLDADDIPDHSAAKLTSGTIGSSIIADDAVTAAKLADESTTLFAGASASDDVTTFPDGDFKGQFFYDETGQDLYIYTGTAFVPITVLSGNLVNAGAYNASTNLMSSVTTAGSSAGFSVGAALPAPAGVNLNHYVVVDTSGTGSGAAPAVALAPPDMLLSQGVGTEYQLIDVSNAIAGQTASNISLIASGDITATDVQAGIQELDTEKLPKAGGTMTGDLTLNNVNVVFEGSTADDYETTLTVTDPTADRTITLPNVTGTVVTTGDTGSVTSTMITDGTIVNADINASAEIAVSKLANGTARQLLQTDAAGTGVEFTSNVDVPGTLDVTGAATLDSTASVAGLLSADGKISFTAGTAALPAIYSGSDTNTGIYSPGADQFGISTAGTARFYIGSSGNVGIGTTSPSYALHIEGAAPYVRAKNTSAPTDETIWDFAAGTDGVLRLRNTNDAGSSSNNWLEVERNGVQTDSIRFATGSGSERMRIDSSGRLLIGTSSARTNLINGTLSAQLQVEGINHSASSASLIRNSNDSNNAFLTLGKTRGTANGSNTIVQNGDTLGNLTFLGADGTNLIRSAEIVAQVDGTPGSNDMPGRLIFSTTADGASSPTERLRINSSGRVGLGTTSPVLAPLHINQGSNGFALNLQEGSSANPKILFTTTAGNTGGTVIEGAPDTSGGFLAFSTGNSESVRIDDAGNVGIGTTSPFTTLHVVDSGSGTAVASSGTTDATTGARIGRGSVGIDVGILDNGTSYLQNRNVTNFATNYNFVVNPNGGNVGIGTSSPAQKLHVNGTGQFSRLGITDQNVIVGADSSGCFIKASSASGNAKHLLIDNTEPGQGVYIRTTKSGTSTAVARVVSDHDGDFFVMSESNGPIVSTTQGAGTTYFHFVGRHSGTAGTANSGTASYLVYTNGDVRNTNNSYGAISDQKLKANIVDANSQWEDIKALQIRNYNFKESTGHETHTQLGVIAQEVETVSPGLVSETPDLDENGDDLGTTTKSVNYSVLYMKAVKALQEAMAKIETLETKVAALEAAN